MADGMLGKGAGAGSFARLRTKITGSNGHASRGGFQFTGRCLGCAIPATVLAGLADRQRTFTPLTDIAGSAFAPERNRLWVGVLLLNLGNRLLKTPHGLIGRGREPFAGNTSSTKIFVRQALNRSSLRLGAYIFKM